MTTSVRRLAAAAVAAAIGHVAVHALAKAPARRYTAAGGIVTDTMTKLIWQQLAPAQTQTFDDAKTHCKGLELNGTGWRLPTIKELQTIFDHLAGIDPVFLPTTDPAYDPGTATGWYWSSTSSARYPEFAWAVTFAGGGSGTRGKTIPSYVRCVR